jgi:hypothetical protein
MEYRMFIGWTDRVSWADNEANSQHGWWGHIFDHFYTSNRKLASHRDVRRWNNNGCWGVFYILSLVEQGFWKDMDGANGWSAITMGNCWRGFEWGQDHRMSGTDWSPVARCSDGLKIPSP